MGRPIVELVEFGAKRLGQFEISKAPSNNGTVCVVSALTALRLDSVPRQRTPLGSPSAPDAERMPLATYGLKRGMVLSVASQLGG